MKDRLSSLVTSLAHPRFPGSCGAQKARQRIRSLLEGHNIKVMEVDHIREIHRQTLKFTNLLGMARGSPRFLLVAHADTLCAYEGAVDAATCMAVCADLATRHNDVMIALVDGEEPYPPHKWSETTAMSGSLHLIKWLQEQAIRPDYVFVLDLWGGPPTSVFTVHQGASEKSLRVYESLAMIERHMYPSATRLFHTTRRAQATQDDSWPFLQQPEVYPRVIDLLATPFPPQWHKRGVDTAAQVDYDVLVRCATVLDEFITTH